MIFRNSLLPAAPCAGNSGRNRDITLHLIQHFSPTMQCQCSCTLRNPNPWMAVLSLDPAVRIPSSPVGDHRNPCEGDPISSVILRDGPAGSAKEQQQMTQVSLTSCSQGRTSCLSPASTPGKPKPLALALVHNLPFLGTFPLMRFQLKAQLILECMELSW